jgi:hypothetical protein
MHLCALKHQCLYWIDLSGRTSLICLGNLYWLLSHSRHRPTLCCLCNIRPWNGSIYHHPTSLRIFILRFRCKMNSGRHIQAQRLAEIRDKLQCNPSPLKLRSRLTVHDQIQSIFLSRLPPEIRVQIYEELLSDLGHERHITFDEGKLVSGRCITHTDNDLLIGPPWNYPVWTKGHSWCLEFTRRAGASGIRVATSYIYLLRSCKRVYVFRGDVRDVTRIS